MSLIETAGLKLFASKSSILDLLASYNYGKTTLKLSETLNGTQAYSASFLADAANQALIAGASDPTATGFSLSDFHFADVDTEMVTKTYQGKASWDWEFLKGQLLSLGAEAVLDESAYKTDQSVWTDTASGSGSLQFALSNFSMDGGTSSKLSSGAFGLCEFKAFSGLLSGEAGVRANFGRLYDGDSSIEALPTIDPRLRLEITPWVNRGWVRSLGFSVGSGLYSQMPSDSSLFASSLRLDGGKLAPTRSWFNLLGVHLEGEDNWKLSLEGYYKRYYDRLYLVTDLGAETSLRAMNDGKGYALGEDLLVSKRLGRYWDGWISYSYSLARYLNPAQASYPGQTSSAGEPLGAWYYPSYHRFHTANLVLDWRPSRGFAATITASLASGAPKASVGEGYSYATVYTDPDTGQSQVIERYARTSSYDDELRNDLSCPINLKLAWSGFYTGSKIRWECYFGVENILANLYSPKTNSAFDPFTGEELSGSGEADFSIGFPIPSFGYKLSY